MTFFDPLIPQAFAQDSSSVPSVTEVGGMISYVLIHLPAWTAGVVVILFFFILAKWIALVIRKRILNSKRERISENSIVLIERVTRLLTIILGFTIALAINGFNFTTIIGFVSIGIGFAIQDIVANFISSMVMLVQDRIRIGDTISINGVLGNIVGMDRNTIIKAFDGTQIIVPNKTMLNSIVVNYTMNPFRRIELMMKVDYKTDLAQAMGIIQEVIKKSTEVILKPEPMIIISEFGESAIILGIYFWIESNRKGWPKIASNIGSAIKEAFDEAGIKIPVPIRTLKIDEDDRAFLKTMQSIRKGEVPTPHVIKNEPEVIEEVSKKTEDLGQIPIDVLTPVPVEVPVVMPEIKAPKAPPTHL